MADTMTLHAVHVHPSIAKEAHRSNWREVYLPIARDLAERTFEFTPYHYRFSLRTGLLDYFPTSGLWSLDTGCVKSAGGYCLFHSEIIEIIKKNA